MRFLSPLFKIVFSLIIISVLLYFLGYLFNRPLYDVPDTVVHDTTLPQLKIDNYTFHLDTFGDPCNPLIIILHGGPGFDYRYLLDLKALSNNYFIAFYDRRGAGLSERVEYNTINFSGHINDLHGILTYFGRDTSYLIGHDWGAILAISFISRYPDLVQKTVIAEPVFLNEGTAMQFLQNTNYLRPDFNVHSLVFFLKSYFESLHIKNKDQQSGNDYFFSKLMYGHYQGHPLEGYFCEDKINSPIPFWRSGAISSQATMSSVMNENGEMTYSFVNGIENYKGRILLLSGKCNSITGYNHQLENAALLPNCKIEIINDAGHYIFNDNPEVSIKAIRKFLKHKKE